MSDTGLIFSSRPVLMLAAGAVLGLVLVATDLFLVADDFAETSPEGVVATVNGVSILSAEYGSALDRYALSRGRSLDGQDSTLVLDSMIDEELLVQRARDLGIDRNDRLVRDLMTKTVVERPNPPIQPPRKLPLFTKRTGTCLPAPPRSGSGK